MCNKSKHQRKATRVKRSNHRWKAVKMCGILENTTPSTHSHVSSSKTKKKTHTHKTQARKKNAKKNAHGFYPDTQMSSVRYARNGYACVYYCLLISPYRIKDIHMYIPLAERSSRRTCGLWHFSRFFLLLYFAILRLRSFGWRCFFLNSCVPAWCNSTGGKIGKPDATCSFHTRWCFFGFFFAYIRTLSIAYPAERSPKTEKD